VANIGSSAVFGSVYYVNWLEGKRNFEYRLEYLVVQKKTIDRVCKGAKEALKWNVKYVKNDTRLTEENAHETALYHLHINDTQKGLYRKVLSDKEFNEYVEHQVHIGLVKDMEKTFLMDIVTNYSIMQKKFIHAPKERAGVVDEAGNKISTRLVTAEDEKKRLEWQKKKILRARRFGLEEAAEGYRKHCNGLAPVRIALEYYFVIAAITCVSLELASLLMGLFSADLAMKIRALVN